MPFTVRVVGLGPGDQDLLSPASLAAIRAVPVGRRYLRTARHPAAGVVEWGTTFDRHYEAAEELESVYMAIVEDLVAAACAGTGDLVYAVPGSPLIAEHTVDLLRARARTHHDELRVEILPALSFLDLCWAALDVDPLACGARLVDGHDFARQAAGQTGPLLVAQCDSRFVLSEVKLALSEAAELAGREAEPVVVLQRLGLPDRSVTTVAVEDLDRSFEPDHLTSLWLPEVAAPIAAELVEFVEVVRRLREECPWDRAQTHGSLAPYVIEEAHEVAHAMDLVEAYSNPEDVPSELIHELEEELGDVLLQVALHSAIATQEGWFTLADVAKGIREKMVRRHPHVFSGLEVNGAEQIIGNWDAIKRQEKADAGKPYGLFDGVPVALPALQQAAKVARKAMRAGTLERQASSENADLDESALGEQLWQMAVAAEKAGLEPESALRRTLSTYRTTLDLRQGEGIRP